MAGFSRARPRILRISALLAVGLLGGCLVPRSGTPVFVEARAGRFWSGKGMLVEVSEDRTRCRVRVRDRALLVRDLWVSCLRVHPRTP